MITHPKQIKWKDGPLPLVETVPYDCWVLAWFVHDIPEDDFERFSQLHEVDPERINGKLCRITACHPWKNSLNPLRWCDSSGHPVGYQERVVHWAWIKEGEIDQNDWKDSGF